MAEIVIYLLALIAIVPVIVAFQVGLLFGLSFAVWLLLGQDYPAGTAEQETEGKKLSPGWATQEDDAALGYANLTPQGGFKCIYAGREQVSPFLAGGRFLREG